MFYGLVAKNFCTMYFATCLCIIVFCMLAQSRVMHLSSFTPNIREPVIMMMNKYSTFLLPPSDNISAFLLL